MKKLLLIISILSIFAFGTITVKAAEMTHDEACASLLGNPANDGSVAHYVQLALNIIKYAGIILCIVLTIVDFAKALFGEDKDMLKNLSKKGLHRLFYAVALFFLPIIVKTILTLIDIYDTCGIS